MTATIHRTAVRIPEPRSQEWWEETVRECFLAALLAEGRAYLASGGKP